MRCSVLSLTLARLQAGRVMLRQCGRCGAVQAGDHVDQVRRLLSAVAGVERDAHICRVDHEPQPECFGDGHAVAVDFDNEREQCRAVAWVWMEAHRDRPCNVKRSACSVGMLAR